jgi:hypothetical protein
MSESSRGTAGRSGTPAFGLHEPSRRGGLVDSLGSLSTVSGTQAAESGQNGARTASRTSVVGFPPTKKRSSGPSATCAGRSKPSPASRLPRSGSRSPSGTSRSARRVHEVHSVHAVARLKWCGGPCGRELPLRAFYLRSGSDRRRHQCIACCRVESVNNRRRRRRLDPSYRERERARMRAQYARHRDARLAYARTRYWNLKLGHRQAA